MEQVELEKLVNDGKSIADIANIYGKGKTTVRHWLKKYNLKTNGRSKKEVPVKNGKRRCGRCSDYKDMSEYLERKDRPGQLGSYCKQCRAEQVRDSDRSVKAELVEYMGGCCSDCGKTGDARIFDFHHLEPEHKDFNIRSKRIKQTLTQTLKELKKCVLLCANCHSLRHREMKLDEGYKSPHYALRWQYNKVAKLETISSNPACTKCQEDEPHVLNIIWDDNDRGVYGSYNKNYENWDEDFTRALKSANILCNNCRRL